ncbi:MAG: AAA family ATPase [Chloroflexi bacterium]|nr:AAA family ATPase [Chloroflexota bacterium]
MSTTATMIPEELKELPQWVVWKYEEPDGKPTKVPYTSTTRVKASTTDPATWETYEKALAASGDWDGIGFVFTGDDPFAGVDLDHCRNSETGEIDPEVREIVGRLDSYTEVTPSGTGLHVICRGALPPGGRKKGTLEVYDCARYFTVTGRHLEGTPTTIEERTEQLATVHARYFGKAEAKAPKAKVAASLLHDAELLEKARAAKNGAKFTALMGGDTSGYDSQSEADGALCSLLAFWSRDAIQIDRLFRQSGLYREKWDERHYGDGHTYGEGTIEGALALTTEAYTPGLQREQQRNGPEPNEKTEGKPLLKTLRVLAVAEIEEPGPRQWRIQDLAPEHYPASIYGDGGQGKSFLALAAGTTVTVGGSFLGMPTIKGKTLYLDWELDAEEFARRAYQVARGMGLDGPPADLLYVNASLPLLSIKAELENEVRTRGINFLIIDSLGAAAGGNPNAPELMIPTLQMLRDLGKSSLVIDHQSKMQEGQHYENKTAYGNAYKGFLSRSVWQIEKGESEERHTLELLMRPKKANFGPLMEPVGVKITFGSTTVKVERVDAADVPSLVEKLPLGDQLLAELAEGEASVDELIASTGKPKGTVQNQLTRLRRASKIVTIDGTWHLNRSPNPESQSLIGRDSGFVSEGGADPRTEIPHLVESLGWPAVTLGERQVNGRARSMGVPAGRAAWEMAVKNWPPDMLRELLEKLKGGE